MTTPLRLVLLTDSLTVPAWIASLASRLASLHGTAVAAIANTDVPPLPGLLVDAFLDFDERLQRGASGLFLPTSLRAALPDVPLISPQHLAAGTIDLLIDFRTRPTDIHLVLPRLGRWTWAELAPSSGFRAVLRRDPLMECQLIAHLPHGQTRLIRNAVFATDWISAARNRNHYFIKAASTLIWALKKLNIEGEEKFLSALSPFNTQTPAKPIRLSDIAALAVKQAGRKLEKYVRPSETWLVMAARTPANLLPDLDESRPILPPQNVYWADPMAVERGGKVYLFVEEYVREQRRGRIVCLTLDETGRIASRQIALERPYHLSYPFVFTHRGETYMVPETSAQRTIELHRCTQWPDRWEFECNLMSNVYAVDTTLLEHNGRWWLFTNLKTEPGASSWDELHVFHADDPLSTEWTPHPLNPVVSDVRRARPAGRIFEFGGRLFRPSQDCSLRYGYALNFNRIETLTTDAYQETHVERILPREGMRTIHTFSRAGGWDFVDGATRKKTRNDGSL